MSATPPHAERGLTIPWQWVSVILGTVAVGCLGSLVVVAHKTSADALSTVALALAVLAFAAQLIVSLAQGMASTQLVGQVERVNSDTQSALSAIRATSEALVATQQKQFSDVLQAAIARASSETLDSTSEFGPEHASIDSTMPEFSQAVLKELTAILSSQGTRSSSSQPRHVEPTNRYWVMTRMPGAERGQELAQIVDGLTPWEARSLTDRVLKARARAREGRSTEGLFPANVISLSDLSPANDGLITKGLVTARQQTDSQGHPRVWSDLTDLGAEIAPVLLPPAGTDTPEWYFDAMKG